MKVKLKGLGTIIKKTFKGWNEDDPFRQSSVIAYYAIFSLPALLVLIINVAGFFFGKEKVSEEITKQIGDAMGASTAEQIGSIVTKAGETKAGIISSMMAIITIIFGATGVFVQLQTNLNQIWDVKQKSSKGFLLMLKHRLFSFGLIVSIGFLLLMSLVISTMLTAFSHWIEGSFPDAIAYLFYALEFVVSLLVITVLFMLMFKILPDVKLKWRDVIVGSLLTGLLFILGKYGMSFYFGKAEPASVYGAAGSIILILLWTSYSSMIVFFGAEFTKQYSVYHGLKIEPTKDAEKITAAETQKIAPKKSQKEEGYAGVESNTSRKKEVYAMKNREEIQTEINRLERKAYIEKVEIKENFKFIKLVSSLLSKLFGSNKKQQAKLKHVYLSDQSKSAFNRNN